MRPRSGWEPREAQEPESAEPILASLRRSAFAFAPVPESRLAYRRATARPRTYLERLRAATTLRRIGVARVQ